MGADAQARDHWRMLGRDNGYADNKEFRPLTDEDQKAENYRRIRITQTGKALDRAIGKT